MSRALCLVSLCPRRRVERPCSATSSPGRVGTPQVDPKHFPKPRFLPQLRGAVLRARKALVRARQQLVRKQHLTALPCISTLYIHIHLHRVTRTAGTCTSLPSWEVPPTLQGCPGRIDHVLPTIVESTMSSRHKHLVKIGPLRLLRKSD